VKIYKRTLSYLFLFILLVVAEFFRVQDEFMLSANVCLVAGCFVLLHVEALCPHAYFNRHAAYRERHFVSWAATYIFIVSSQFSQLL
jgi:hypothetical protein